MPTRRRFLATSAAVASTALLHRRVNAAPEVTASVPVTQLTTGETAHWFGYYDKLQTSRDDSLALTGRVSFEGRSPAPGDAITVGWVSTDPTTAEDDRKMWPIGESRAWGWQQGCMLQWVPESDDLIWNDFEDGRFVSRLKSTHDPDIRTIDAPIYALAPDGSFAVTTDFERIQNMRPGYGYAGVVDSGEAEKAPESSGISRVDLKTGEKRLLVSYAEMAAIPHEGQSLADKWHYFNHLLVDPVGERMIFLHRWRDQPKRQNGKTVPNAGSFKTRLVTCRCDDGGDRYILDPSGATSHFIWRDPEHICAWTRWKGKDGFFLFRDRTREVLPVGAHVMTRNGHNTYVPGTNAEWILNDTYPVGPDRLQTVYLYHVPSSSRFDLASFPSPPPFTGEYRCDLHPRNSRDGSFIIVDSAHSGQRQQYRLEIESVLAKRG